MSRPEALPSSYRDPSGFVFRRHDGRVARYISHSYRADYDHLVTSGLYDALARDGLIVAHEESAPFGDDPNCYKVIEPERIPFISHPYEWSFSALKEAALLTLAIEERALSHGMTLKDASAFNVQFIGTAPIFIDTLSFQRYEEGTPWVAYRQFCEHFLATLAVMAKVDVRLSRYLFSSLDGVPLDLASRLLPLSTKFSFGLLTHLHLHARSQSTFADAKSVRRTAGRTISLHARRALIDHLRTTVQKLTWIPGGTEWGDYYSDTNYSAAGETHKAELVSAFLQKVPAGMAWDFGANTGRYSSLAAERGMYTVAWDIDVSAVEKGFRACRKKGERGLLPLQLDLMNPSPAVGWALAERDSLVQRGPAAVVLALALIHHLSIARNVPLAQVAELFARCGERLIIEFVPKGDSQVQRLLASRPDIFPSYTQEGFEDAFSRYFTIEEAHQVRESSRVLYLMTRR